MRAAILCSHVLHWLHTLKILPDAADIGACNPSSRNAEIDHIFYVAGRGLNLFQEFWFHISEEWELFHFCKKCTRHIHVTPCKPLRVALWWDGQQINLIITPVRHYLDMVVGLVRKMRAMTEVQPHWTVVIRWARQNVCLQ